MPGNQYGEGKPPETKIRVVATVDEFVVKEMKFIHEQEEKIADKSNHVKPDWSNTVEMLLRKGIKAYKRLP